MADSFERFFSDASHLMKKSAIREILKLTQQPEMISFAGGLPSPDSFPIEDIKRVTSEVLEEDGRAALQYGTTEGDTKLRALLAERHRKDGLDLAPENIIITTGSQQALDLCGKIFINRGDVVLCGLPSYLGGLNAFSNYGALLKGIPLDDHGMMPEQLEKTIISLKQEGKTIKFIYIIPDFQNPTGVTLPRARRMEIISIAEKHDLLIVEDSPYRDVRFAGTPEPLMSSLDTRGRVMTLNTFSKILAPGFRLAWVTGHREIIDKLVTSKQAADLCTPPFVQKITAKYIEKGLLDINLRKTVELYRQRRDYMLKCFREKMPEGVKWTEPDGGLFLFVTLPSSMDAARLLERAIRKKVAFVCGSVFYCNNEGHNTMRINFSFSDEKDTCEGVTRLADAIREEMARS
ncbi:MAG TPA: PLP-dependent aminotransferase family protein [Bacteroidales bacterium]|jgi:2-aminoadipate transaminase|nr:PLP-dependent aminotransferase family protein [Bacteroidales bacterium]NLD63236.1 PLP-dependent aminotransferase family protein [Bacteroidales bacterium]HNT93470.1 PLP-dependent aminotransferase family protein [Bacteroidales bacterium]HOO65413.1 PLP-dependent aminotransferase family protein [Bacteroidales bacterium]HPE21766.1 PLP-dependent aminotransferase family protein [Bacteroidales bacterium]